MKLSPKSKEARAFSRFAGLVSSRIWYTCPVSDLGESGGYLQRPRGLFKGLCRMIYQVSS